MSEEKKSDKKQIDVPLESLNPKELTERLKILNQKILQNIKLYEEEINSNFDSYITKVENSSLKHLKIIEDNIKNDEERQNNYGESIEVLDEAFSDIEFLKSNLKQSLDDLFQTIVDKEAAFKLSVEQRKANELSKNLGEQITFKNLDEMAAKGFKMIKVKAIDESQLHLCKTAIENALDIEKIILKIKNSSEKALMEKLDLKEGKAEDDIDLSNIVSVSLKNCTFQNFDVTSHFKNLMEFTIKSCKVPFTFFDNINFINLSKLCIEDVGLTNETFDLIFYKIRQNKNIRSNLSYMSFKKNNISFVDIYGGINDGDQITEGSFPNLETIDLSQNNIYSIYKITTIFNGMTKLNYFDLSNNNLCFIEYFKDFLDACTKMKCFCMLSKNLLIMKEKPKNLYLKYLVNIIDILPELNKNIKFLDLESLFYLKRSKKVTLITNEGGDEVQLNIAEITVTPDENLKRPETPIELLNLTKFNNSLVELNLSQNSLDDLSLIKLLKNNFACPNIEKLYLKYNNLTEKTFDLFVENKINEIFPKLKFLDLSGNEFISFTNAENLIKYFENFKNIEKLILKNTKMDEIINQYLKTKVVKYFETERKIKKTTPFIPVQLELEKIIEEKYLSKNTNTTIELNDQIKTKYTSQLKKHLPHLIERIILYAKFAES